jgi:uncharacterized protein
MSLDIEQLKPDVQRLFAERAGVVAVLLFGSYAAGRAGPLSDVDIAVLADVKLDKAARHEVQMRVIEVLFDLLPGAELDVVLLNDASLALQYRVLEDGVLLFCSDKDAFVLFKAQAISMYLDFKPALDYREARVIERARRGELTSGPNPHRRAFEHHRRRGERPATDAGVVR